MDTSTIPTCPWCRCEIKGTEAVRIEPYKPGKTEQIPEEPASTNENQST